MVEMIKQGVTIVNGKTEFTTPANIDAARDKTMAYRIFRAHDKSTDSKKMRIKFDALITNYF